MANGALTGTHVSTDTDHVETHNAIDAALLARLVYKGAYSTTATYATNDVVTYGGVTYVAKQAVAAGSAAPATTSWDTLATTAGATSSSAPGTTKTTVINDSADSLGSWTQTTSGGSWSAANGYISQTTAATGSNSLYRLRNVTSFTGVSQLVTCKIRIPSAGQTNGNMYGGIVFGPASGSGGALIRLQQVGGTWQIQWEQESVSAITAVNVTAAFDTWYPLRVDRISNTYAVTFNGSLVGTNAVGVSVDTSYLVLYSNATKVDFDDLYVAVDTTVALPVRAVTSITTASLAAGASATGTFTVAGTGYRIYALQTSAAARVRLYTTAALRDADSSRATTTTPGAGSGVILDYVTTGSTYVALSPLADGFNDETTPSNAIPYTITATGAGAITVTLTYIRTE